MTYIVTTHRTACTCFARREKDAMYPLKFNKSSLLTKDVRVKLEPD